MKFKYLLSLFVSVCARACACENQLFASIRWQRHKKMAQRLRKEIKRIFFLSILSWAKQSQIKISTKALIEHIFSCLKSSSMTSTPLLPMWCCWNIMWSGAHIMNRSLWNVWNENRAVTRDDWKVKKSGCKQWQFQTVIASEVLYDKWTHFYAKWMRWSRWGIRNLILRFLDLIGG